MEWLSTFSNIVLVLIGFGVLIFVHELGHFVAAKWAGIRTEAFAIGMGPVVCSWRKGIGFKLGSTHKVVVGLTGKEAAKLKEEELRRHGLGETEYSLRWLPFGGFVKMLGQEDLNPNYVSDDARSYQRCPVGKRMVVVSAGVIMNILLAAVLFIAAFMLGVRFDAPIIGEVSATMPAGTTMPDNAEALGIDEPGLRAGDRVLRIDGTPAETFADLHLAAAMSTPGTPVHLRVQREGYDEPLAFAMSPEVGRQGLRSIGVTPASSTRLFGGDQYEAIRIILDRAGLTDDGVEPGMTMLEADGRPISNYGAFDEIVRARDGRPVPTRWTATNAEGEAVGGPINAVVSLQPVYDNLRYTDAETAPINFEQGLYGLTPLVRVRALQPGSPNAGIINIGDVILKIGNTHAPRMRQLMEFVQKQPGGPINMTVLRDGQVTDIVAQVERTGVMNRRGVLKIELEPAWDMPYFAQPMHEVVRITTDGTIEPQPTPVSDLGLVGGGKFESIGDQPVTDWSSLRAALRSHTNAAHAVQSEATVPLTVTSRVGGATTETFDLTLSADQVRELHELGWTTALPSYAFEPLQVTRSAGGNPLRAISMGIQETHKMMLMTYLTIDRLFRRTVQINQLRGPVGIIDIGVDIMDRGFVYMLFFLGMISVNLAVINFLPLPIVDGGLFLFLVYEKFKGRPPSVAFQNITTWVGLFLIATVFIVVTFNDLVRLLV